ncbi:MAG: redoxin domain-containing protein [Bacteroidales bacterium]|jgi:thioredoxin-related protein|nr:redoxin domain-containing protein [Bacteroidales bacterium]
MKIIFICLFLLNIFFCAISQEFYALNEPLKTLDGSLIEMNDVLTSKQGTILIFWETNSHQCCNNLENLQDSWVEELKKLGIELIAICVNCPGNWAKVKPLVAGKGWDFDVYIDINGQLKRTLGITTTPYTVLLDGDKNIRCRYPGYCSGDEVQICEKIKHCLENDGDLAALK